MNIGMLLTIATSDNGIMIKILNLFSIGTVSTSDEYGRGTTLIAGIWRFYTSINLEYRYPQEVDGKNAGIS